MLYIIPGMEGGRMSLIWSNEETGFRHLYLITAHLSSYSNGLDAMFDSSESE